MTNVSEECFAELLANGYVKGGDEYGPLWSMTAINDTEYRSPYDVERWSTQHERWVDSGYRILRGSRFAQNNQRGYPRKYEYEYKFAYFLGERVARIMVGRNKRLLVLSTRRMPLYDRFLCFANEKSAECFFDSLKSGMMYRYRQLKGSPKGLCFLCYEADGLLLFAIVDDDEYTKHNIIFKSNRSMFADLVKALDPECSLIWAGAGV